MNTNPREEEHHEEPREDEHHEQAREYSVTPNTDLYLSGYNIYCWRSLNLWTPHKCYNPVGLEVRIR